MVMAHHIYLSNLLEFKSATEFDLQSNFNKYLLEMPSSRLVYGGDRAFYAASLKEYSFVGSYGKSFLKSSSKQKRFLYSRNGRSIYLKNVIS